MYTHGTKLGKIFIGGLGSETSTDSLRRYFEKYGELCDCVIMTDKNTNRSRGFGFITLNDSAKVDAILRSQPHVIDGKQVDCKIAIPKDYIGNIGNDLQLTQEQQSSGLFNNRKIFVGGLHPALREIEMKAYFEQFGEVEQCVIMHDKPTGKSRGFGFVIFAKEYAADQVMQAKNRHSIMGKWVDCKRAMPKELIGKDGKPVNEQGNSNNSKIQSQNQNQGQNQGQINQNQNYNYNNYSQVNQNEMDTNVNYYNQGINQINTVNPLNPKSNVNQNYVVNNYYINQPISIQPKDKLIQSQMSQVPIPNIQNIPQTFNNPPYYNPHINSSINPNYNPNNNNSINPTIINPNNSKNVNNTYNNGTIIPNTRDKENFMFNLNNSNFMNPYNQGFNGVNSNNNHNDNFIKNNLDNKKVETKIEANINTLGSLGGIQITNGLNNGVNNSIPYQPSYQGNFIPRSYMQENKTQQNSNNSIGNNGNSNNTYSLDANAASFGLNVNSNSYIPNNYSNKISPFGLTNQTQTNTNSNNMVPKESLLSPTSTSSSTSSMINNKSSQDPSLFNLITNLDKKSPNSNSLFNYFYYKLLDFHGEDLSRFSHSSYENYRKVELFKEDEEEKKKYEILKDFECDTASYMSMETEDKERFVESYIGPQKSKKQINIERNFKPY